MAAVLFGPALLCALAALHSVDGKDAFMPFKSQERGEFGLLDASGKPCMSLKLHALLHSLQANSSAGDSEAWDFTADDVQLSGFCALPNEVHKHSALTAQRTVRGRRRSLSLTFAEDFLPVLGQPVYELRWLLQQVVYKEQGKSRTLVFRSPNDSTVVSAPLRQRFLCKDPLNITLGGRSRRLSLELLPEMQLQPVSVGAGFGSNIYVCERTRRRTLSQSFQSHVTIFSGVVLGLSSVGTLAGYSLWRQLLPSRRVLYNDM